MSDLASGLPPPFSSRTTHSRKQAVHFYLLVVATQVVTVAALVSLPWRPVGWPELSALAFMWCVTGIGVSVGFHRCFSHQAFRVGDRLAILFAIAGSMAAQGSVLSWVTVHRCHHRFSDEAGDPHSPANADVVEGSQWRRFLFAHFLWMRKYDYPNPRHYARDLLRKRSILKINKQYYPIVLMGVLIPAVYVGFCERSLGGLLEGAIWGGAVRMTVLSHTIWSINSALHMTGSRAFDTHDNSRNSALFGLLSFGESFHNNHHKFPRSALLSLNAPILDPGYLAIRVLAFMRLAHDVHMSRADKAADSKRRRRQAPKDFEGVESIDPT